MSRHGPEQFVFAWLVMALLTCEAGAQELASKDVKRSCYEVVMPASTTQPQQPLRVNKCTGETWILAATRAAGQKRARSYRWIPLEVDKVETGTRDATVASPQPDVRANSQDNCFEFAARRFCE